MPTASNSNGNGIIVAQALVFFPTLADGSLNARARHAAEAVRAHNTTKAVLQVWYAHGVVAAAGRG